MADSFNKLYIGSLPQSINDEMLITALQKYGPLKSFFMPKEHGTHKGYAFCEYISPDDTINAIKFLNGFSHGGKDWIVKYAVDNPLKTFKEKPDDIAINEELKS